MKLGKLTFWIILGQLVSEISSFHDKQGVHNYLKNPVEKMIFESIRGRYEKVSFLAFKTKIHKVYKSQKVNFLRKFDSDKTLL